MKKVIVSMSIVAFLFATSLNAQDKKDKKAAKAKTEKSCSSSEKKGCCASKKMEEQIIDTFFM